METGDVRRRVRRTIEDARARAQERRRPRGGGGGGRAPGSGRGGDSALQGRRLRAQGRRLPLCRGGRRRARSACRRGGRARTSSSSPSTPRANRRRWWGGRPCVRGRRRLSEERVVAEHPAPRRPRRRGTAGLRARVAPALRRAVVRRSPGRSSTAAAASAPAARDPPVRAGGARRQRSNRAVAPQARHFRVREPEFAENGVGVLSQNRRRRADRRGRVAQLDRDAELPDRTGHRVLEARRPSPARRSAGRSAPARSRGRRRREPRRPSDPRAIPRPRRGAQPLDEQRAERLARRHAILVRAEARVVGQRLEAEHAAERPPELVVADRDDQIPVGRRERLVRRDRPVAGCRAGPGACRWRSRSRPDR